MTAAAEIHVPAHREVREVAPADTITPMSMIDRALATGASVDTLSQLMSLQERWEAGQARRAFDRAIAEAKAAIPPIFKDSLVDYTSTKGRTTYRHETLAGIARTVDPVLSAHGLC